MRVSIQILNKFLNISIAFHLIVSFGEYPFQENFNVTVLLFAIYVAEGSGKGGII